MSNNNFISYSMPVLPYWPLRSSESVIDINDVGNFKSLSSNQKFLELITVEGPDPRFKDIQGANILEAVFEFLRLLRFRSGAQFFRFKMSFTIKSNLAFNESDYNNKFFEGYDRLENANIPHWQKLIREQIDLQLLKTLNRFELVEFLYFNVISVQFHDHDFSSEESIKKFGYFYSVRLEVFLAIRSIVGADCSERFSQLISQPLAIPKNYSGAFFEFFSLNFEEANTCLRRLMCFVPAYSNGRFDRDKVNMIFHGWYCFRSWLGQFRNGKFTDQELEFHKNYKQKFLYPYEFFFWWFSLFPDAYEMYPYEESLYSPFFTEDATVLGKNHVRHKHADILGLSVANTYDSPSVLLNLVRSYCILKEIKLIDGQLFKLINKSFLKPLGPLSWFKFNIFNILEELTDDFPISIASIEIPLLVSKQLKNVLELIELNPNIIFKELESFISDPVVDCFEITNKQIGAKGSFFDSRMYYRQEY